MKFEKLLAMTIDTWNKSETFARFEAINSRTSEVINIINRNISVTDNEVSLVRYFFLDIAEYIGGPVNASDISRHNSDHQILSALNRCKNENAKIAELQKLNKVGESTSTSVLAFLFPHIYTLTNGRISCSALTIFDEISNQKGEHTNTIQIINSYLQREYTKNSFRSAVEMSAYLLFLYSLINSNVSKKGISGSMSKAEKFKIKLNRFIND